MVWGYLLSIFSFLGVCFFSFFFYLNDSLLLSWLSLELSTLCLVPLFFSLNGCSLTSLFSYLVVSGVSSGLIVLGILFPDLWFFILLGFSVKFGLFPFMGWIYDVLGGSNWLVIYCFSVVLKSSFFILCYFLNGVSQTFIPVLEFSCCSTLLILSFLFWLFTPSWQKCWTHMMLSSSCVLLLMSLTTSVGTLFWFFTCYFLWGSFCVLFFSVYDSYKSYSFMFLPSFIFLLISSPVSISVLYKLFIGFSLFSCSPLVFMFWVFYSISEQFYLFKYAISFSIPKKLGNLSRLV